jgi:hypothetical protein
LPQPVGVGLSQSIEIPLSPVPSQPVASRPPSASVIIPVTEVELLPGEPVSHPAVTAPSVQATDSLPASIITAQSPIAMEIAQDAKVSSPRERTRRNQILISFLLLGLVVVLAVILVWVLKRNVTPPPEEKKAAAVDVEANHLAAITSNSCSKTADPHFEALEL